MEKKLVPLHLPSLKKKRSKVDTLSYKTKHANSATVKREWHLIDAEDKVLGRLASKIAMILMGKNKPSYTAHCDTGDFVIVLNAGKVKLTGKKMDAKEVIHHTGYPGGQRSEIARDLLARIPERMIENAVKDMLPHTKLGNAMFKKLFVYSGSEHPHKAQQPKTIK